MDIGCGEGLLQEKLRICKYSRYTGIDISSEAIARAADRKDERTEFLSADACEYEPAERYDIVIFNECLYYFDEPARVMRRFEQCLYEEGIFIVSMFVANKTMPIWRTLDSLYTTQDAVHVTNAAGTSWVIKVFADSRR